MKKNQKPRCESYNIYKMCGNIGNKIEIVGYVTVFIYKIRGNPRSAGLN